MAKKSLKPEKRAKSPKSAKTAARAKKTETKRKVVAAAAAPKAKKSVKKQAAAARTPAAAKVAVPKKQARSAAAAPPPRKVAPAAAPPAAAAKAAPAKVAAPKPQPTSATAPPAQNGVETRMTVKKPTLKLEFKTGEHIVYPAHGVGRIVGVESQEVAGLKLDLFVISFIKDKMTLRVPVAKATAVGMRKLADGATVKRALETVRGRARIKRTMWSRRAQEYEAKINSGDPLAIAEVVRDLHRNAGQPDQSFSERQIYEAAMDRLAAELAALDSTDKSTAAAKLGEHLKGQELA